MERHTPEDVVESARPETPEDVAVLLSWANLTTVRYRDFSASRREYRAQMRHRAAQATAEAQQEMQRHAAGAERAASGNSVAQLRAERVPHVRAGARAAQLTSKVNVGSQEAASNSEALRNTEGAATSPEHPLAQQQAELHGPDTSLEPPGLVHTDLPSASVEPVEPGTPAEDSSMAPARFRQRRDVQNILAISGSVKDPDLLTASEGWDSGSAGGRTRVAGSQHHRDTVAGGTEVDNNLQSLAQSDRKLRTNEAAAVGGDLPSWIREAVRRFPAEEQKDDSPTDRTLQDSRLELASRWFALRGVFDPLGSPAESPVEPREEQPPVLAIFSLAGGAGKTSIAASLARALAAQGEKVLVADTTRHGILPFYFGASDIRPDVVRTFAPPPGSSDSPLHLISYEQPLRAADPGAALLEALARDSAGFGRVLVDLSGSGSDLLESLVRRGASVLVPLTPDLTSVVSVDAVRRLLTRMEDGAEDGAVLRFVLNRFEDTSALHIDIREVVSRRLGESLLPFAIRSSSALGEALAEGMTVMDYAPGDALGRDYRQLAAWVRTLKAPATEGLRQARWNEL